MSSDPQGNVTHPDVTFYVNDSNLFCVDSMFLSFMATIFFFYFSCMVSIGYQLISTKKHSYQHVYMKKSGIEIMQEMQTRSSPEIIEEET